MRRGMACTLIVAGALWLGPMAAASTVEDAADTKQPKDPVFVQWLVSGDPGDETIRDYWSRAKRDQLDAAGYVDLGTMLFYRGWPKDAIRMYREALKRDNKLYEAWFRIGLVRHRAMEYEDARAAYKKCLKLLSGNGWCNFYLGLLEEQTSHPTKALEYYRRAYKVAPELADPKINPDVMYSKIQLGAAMRQQDRERFTDTVPMPYLDPAQVETIRARYLPTPTPTPTPTATPKPSLKSRAATRQPPASTTAGGADSGAQTGAGGSSSSGRVRPRPVRTQPTPSADDIDPNSPYGVRRPRPEPDSEDPGTGGGVYGSGSRNVSPEATLRPWWHQMPEWILAVV